MERSKFFWLNLVLCLSIKYLQESKVQMSKISTPCLTVLIPFVIKMAELRPWTFSNTVSSDLFFSTCKKIHNKYEQSGSDSCISNLQPAFHNIPNQRNCIEHKPNSNFLSNLIWYLWAWLQDMLKSWDSLRLLLHMKRTGPRGTRTSDNSCIFQSSKFFSCGLEFSASNRLALAKAGSPGTVGTEWRTGCFGTAALKP